MYKEIITFDLVHETQITKLIGRFPNNKSNGEPDNILNILVKRLCYTFRIPLTLIDNKSLMTATFPYMCKIAELIPEHKGGESVNDNYRPISLLPVLSGILEKIVDVQFQQHLETNNIFFAKQHGFRQKYSTETALSKLAGIQLKYLIKT